LFYWRIEKDCIDRFILALANQALPEGVPSGQADSRRPENVIARSAIQIKSTLSMADGGFRFLLLTFQYLVGGNKLIWLSA
jgi:hypothetical protein